MKDNRLIPDLVKSIQRKDKIKLRSPNATRPWQHVLEAVGGYLCLAINLKNNKNLHGESFNFGPKLHKEYSVLELVKNISTNWNNVSWKIEKRTNKKFFESELLRLNCSKARKILKWKSILSFNETAKMVADWYSGYYLDPKRVNKIRETCIKRRRHKKRSSYFKKRNENRYNES